jgi:membrane dipeptidase
MPAAVPRLDPGTHCGPRILGAAFYSTYAFRPRDARAALFSGLARFRRRVSEGGGILLERKSDLLSAGPGREAYFLAVESLRYLRDPADARKLWDLGVRSLQPVHFLDTRWGGSSREGFLPAGRRGLTPAGRDLLAAMASSGMALDVAHMNARTARECLEAYPGPIFCSHAGFAGTRPSARNVDAALARALFLREGIVGVTCWRHLLAADPSRAAWTRAFCRTAAALADLAPEGRGRVAIGSDRGAPIQVPPWFFSPAHLGEIADELGRMGWSGAEIEGFLWGNAAEFLGRALPEG